MRTIFRTPLLLAAFSLASVGALATGAAGAPSDYRLIPQVGHGDHADAIAIAPGGKWFATAGPAGIVVWDMRSDTVLRELPDSRHMKSLGISRDGAVVLAKTQDGKTRAWSAASGASMSPIPNDAPSSEWTDADHPEGPDPKSTREYIAKIGAEPFLSDMQSDINLTVLGTNVKDVVEIDYYSGPDVGTTSAFYDVAKRKLLVRHVTSPGGDCGQPWGTFAFDGRHLVLSPTARDASAFFADAGVVDAASKPPKAVWQHSCQDYMFANIRLDGGLVMAQDFPDRLTVWDPVSATAIARFDNVNSGANDNAAAIAVDRAHGVVVLSAFGPDKQPYNSEKFGLSISRGGKRIFVGVASAPSEIRLSPDAHTVYAKVDDRWHAWDVTSGTKVAVGALPAALEKAERRGDRAKEERTRDHAFRRIDIEPEPAEQYRTEVRDKSGRVTMAVNARLHLCSDSKHGWSEARSRGQGIDYWDLASGRLLWTASDAFAVSGKETGLLVEFADGRVRLSKGAESLVAMVKGFEHRPFDPKRDADFIER